MSNFKGKQFNELVEKIIKLAEEGDEDFALMCVSPEEDDSDEANVRVLGSGDVRTMMCNLGAVVGKGIKDRQSEAFLWFLEGMMKGSDFNVVEALSKILGKMEGMVGGQEADADLTSEEEDLLKNMFKPK